MDLDLDLFARRDDRPRRGHHWIDDDEDDDDRARRRRGPGRAPRRDDDDDERAIDRIVDDDRRIARRARDERPRGAWYSRRAHPHLFSWLLLGGGVVLLGLALVAIASSLGLGGAIADGYFALSTAVLPVSWHAEWLALPGLVHVAIVLGALFVAAGATGELLD